MINFNWQNLLGRELIFKYPMIYLLIFLHFNLFNIEGKSQGSFMLPALFMSSFLQFLDTASFLLHKGLELDKSSYWIILDYHYYFQGYSQLSKIGCCV